MFAGVAIPAAAVNAGLKLMQKRIQLAFQARLTRHLHARYTANRAYYAASVLGGLTHADQRITEDVEKFAAAVAELYSYTFKPLLDVALFTRSLARIMGYRGQFALYGYYVASATLLRALSPPLALMTAQEAGLSGSLRAAHQRLVASAEEVAFNDPPAGAAEAMILDAHVARLIRHARLSAFQRFVQQAADGYFVKYAASVVALLTYAAPLYFRDPALGWSRDDITGDYIRSMRLLQNTSRGVGDLVLVYKRVTALAGYTARVAELEEAVTRLSSGDPATLARDLYLRNVSSSAALAQGGPSGDLSTVEDVPEPARVEGDVIAFDRVALNAPDGTPLVRELTFQVVPGTSIMVMGPNGSGKSSLLRVLAGLWPLQGGTITSPPQGSVFYLSQRPYLVAGTLRDQLLWPLPPRRVWWSAPPAARAAFHAPAPRQRGAGRVGRQPGRVPGRGHGSRRPGLPPRPGARLRPGQALDGDAVGRGETTSGHGPPALPPPPVRHPGRVHERGQRRRGAGAVPRAGGRGRDAPLHRAPPRPQAVPRPGRPL